MASTSHVSLMTPGTTIVDDADEHFNEIVLSNWDISVILAFAGSRLRACLTHLQREDAPWPSERITRIREGLHWEIVSFILPSINYAVSHSIVPTPAPLVKAILGLFSQNLLCPVSDHLFAARLRLIDPLTEGGDPSCMVDEYHYEWWAPGVAIDLAVPLHWISVKKCVDEHIKQWPEGSEYITPSPQTELGELPFRAQLLLMLERLDMNLLQYEGTIKEKLGDLRVPAQTIMTVDRARDPRVMRAFARGLPVGPLLRNNP